MIGVFDSGLGGLTALRRLKEVAPMCSYVYFGDTGRVPYGMRSQETILRYAMQDLHFLSTFSPKAVLVACGTVSANALYVLRELVQIPVFGVIEQAANAALRATKNGKVAVIGTTATIRTHAYWRALQKNKADLAVWEFACPLFVPLVENDITAPSDPVVQEMCHRYLAGVVACGADTLILGCTHYPLLREAIGAFLPQVTLIDPGAEAAETLRPYAAVEQAPTTDYYVSDDATGFADSASRFLGTSLGGLVHTVEIERY